MTSSNITPTDNTTLFTLFVTTTAIVSSCLTNVSGSISARQLEEVTGFAADKLDALCRDLAQVGFLCKDSMAPGKWRLTGNPDAITLEDVFLHVIAAQKSHARDPCHYPLSQLISTGTYLMITHAMLAIGQSVLRHLRECRLHRGGPYLDHVLPATRDLKHHFVLDEMFNFSGCSF